MGARFHPWEPNVPYFVTATTEKRRPLFADREAARLLLTELETARREFGFGLLSFVIMPDHLHLLLVCGESAPLSRIMQAIKGRFARRWNLRQEDRGQIWQRRYYEVGARTDAQMNAWIQYIDENPVTERLADGPDAYVFSSAGGALGVDLDAYLDGSWSGTKVDVRSG